MLLPGAGCTPQFSRARASSVVVRAQVPQPVQAPRTAQAIIVGGGWAGLGAAYALAKAGAKEVVVIDSADSAGGLAAASTVNGRTVEPGIKGFWSQYRNVYRLVEEELHLPAGALFTPWTSSSFYSPAGLQVTAPVFGSYPRLPSPLGTFFYTLPTFTQLPLADRLSAFPLTRHLLAYHASQDSYRRYDQVNAEQLFRQAGVSPRLIADFLDPILQVVLFAPASKLSAAACLDALNYFALAHQQDFDVRWCRGPVGTRLLRPFADKLKQMGVKFRYQRRLQRLEAHDSPTAAYKLTVADMQGQTQDVLTRAVVFAVGIGAMQRIVAGSPLLGDCPMFQGLQNLSTIDVMAVRLWLDRRVTPRSPSNVLVGFDRGVGATFFDLNTLQDEYRQEAGSVVEVDFYGPTAELLDLPDEALVARILTTYLAAAHPEYAQAAVVDSCVQRFRGAVSGFTPGSAQWMPPTCTTLPGILMAGDWVRQGPGSHGAKGLCQEKALATGLLAGNASVQLLGLQPVVEVLEPEPDEPHIAAARDLVRFLQGVPGATQLLQLTP